MALKLTKLSSIAGNLKLSSIALLLVIIIGSLLMGNMSFFTNNGIEHMMEGARNERGRVRNQTNSPLSVI